MIDAPTMSVVANADNTSIDITLDTKPSGSDKVMIYKRIIVTYGNRNPAYNTLVHTFTATGSFNDDNGGNDYDKYTVIRYIAVAQDDPLTDFSYPSREHVVQVGTLLKYDMLAHVNAIRDILDNASELSDYKTQVLFVDTTPSDEMIYILPDLENPDLHYAAERVEVQLFVNILVINKHGQARKGWIANHDAVQKVLRLLDLNYEFSGKTWDSNVTGVFYNSLPDGWQPEFTVTKITLLSKAQYAKYIP